MAKLHDKETQSIANVVSDVLEGKTKEEGYGKKKIKSGYGEEVKYPHDMFHPETGAKVVAKSEKDHEELSKKGYTHEKPVKEGPEEPRAQGEKEFKKKHVIKKSGENPDGTVTKEDTKASKSLKTHKVEKEPSNSKEVKETKRELTDEQKYKEFFASALKKYGVESPQELDKEKRKEFFNYVDKNYKATNEDVNEGLIDKIKGQLANLKKKKDSGNSEMDDATIQKIAQLLQKKAQVAQKMERADEAAQRFDQQADDAEEAGNDSRAEDLRDRSEEAHHQYMQAQHEIEDIDDEIRELKKKGK